MCITMTSWAEARDERKVGSHRATLALAEWHALLYGADDDATPPQHGEWYARHVPHAQLWVGDGHGHTTQLVDPETRHFLRRAMSL